MSWRVIGTFDTLVLSWLVITFVGPLFGHAANQGAALKAATFIAFTEVFTKMVLYFLHERAWSKVQYGIEKVTDFCELLDTLDHGPASFLKCICAYWKDYGRSSTAMPAQDRQHADSTQCCPQSIDRQRCSIHLNNSRRPI
jgi:hypothetical protein